MTAVQVRRCDVDMFQGLAFKDKDPRKSLKIDEVPLPPLGPNDVLVAVMAAAVNYNTCGLHFRTSSWVHLSADFARLMNS